jgi:hypothetical protein
VSRFLIKNKKKMATKKRHKKTHRVGAKKHTRRHHAPKRRVSGRRRRRVGANDFHDSLIMAAGVTLGAIVTPFGIQAANTALGSAAAQVPGWMIPGGAAVTGGAIMYVGRKNPFALGFGAGMFAIGAVETANEAGLNEPGISGLAMSSNTPGIAMSRAVGCGKRMGGPVNYVNQTVGARKRARKNYAIGAFYSN